MKEIIDSIPTEYRWLIVAGFLPADVLDENGTKCGKDVGEFTLSPSIRSKLGVAKQR